MYRSIYVYVYVCICIQVHIRTRTAPLCTRLSSRVLLTPTSRAAPRALQLAKYCALYSSKGYAVGIKAQKWMLTKEHVKTDELSDELGLTQQARRRRHDLVRQPAIGFRRHGPLPHCVERLPGRPLVLRAPPRTWARTSSRPSGRQRWRRLRPRPRRRLNCWSSRPPTLLRGRRGWGCSV